MFSLGLRPSDSFSQPLALVAGSFYLRWDSLVSPLCQQCSIFWLYCSLGIRITLTMCETSARSNFDSKSHDCTHSVTPPGLNFHSAWAEFSLGLGWVKTSNVKVTFLPSPLATLLGWIQYSGYFVPMYLLVAWRMEMHLNIPHTEQQEFFLQNWVLPGYIFGLHNCTKNAKEVYPCSPLLLATLAGLQLLPLLFDHLNQFLPVRGLFRLDDKMRFVEFNKAGDVGTHVTECNKWKRLMC